MTNESQLSEAKLTANRQNALASTGPSTPEGKATSSRNATTLGLTTGRDFVLPGEENIYQQFTADFAARLAPVDILEQTFADEIRSASWRLRRCGILEAQMAEPGTNPETVNATLKAVERARAQALNAASKALRELRRLQTDRQKLEQPRATPIPLPQPVASFCKTENEPSETVASFCKTSATLKPGIPRSSFCPCKSGKKYKRCCGKDAPAVHGSAPRNVNQAA